MLKFFWIFIIIFTFLTVIQNSNSQPSTIITFKAGYTLPTGYFKGTFGETRETFTTNADSNTYFFKKGINFGLGIDYSPFKDKKFYFTGNFGFVYVSQNKDYVENGGQVTIKYNMNILSMSTGAGYKYRTKTSTLNPFAEAELNVSFFAGSYKETYTDNETNLSLNPEIRMGIQAGCGLEYKISHRIGLQAGVKYIIANLLGKKSKGDTSANYSLNDEETIVNGIKYINRNITYLIIYSGFSIFLGL